MRALELAAFVVWAGPPVAMLPVELAILWRRWRARPGEPRPRTISMVARDAAPRLTAWVFFAAAMPVHWFAPLSWASPSGTVAFWAIQAGLVVWNVAMWRRTALPRRWWPPWLRWVNWPVWYLAAGALAAALLFPQDGPTPWRP